MKKKTHLQQLAISAAKLQQWDQAAQFNQEILELDQRDLGALNRLGVSYLQLDQKSKAKSAFQQVVALDKSNTIARKHLDRIKQNQKIVAPTFTSNTFIEEPGKTKAVDLHRLASKDVLEDLTIGSPCELKPKNRYISIEAHNNYIGALPEDLSFRLTKLMKNGNTYTCHVRSISPAHCVIFLREAQRSKKNQFINSFPSTKLAVSSINDVDDALIKEEDIPVQIVNTDSDVEKTLNDIDQSDD
jgi:tetratricopeptide (TPR) repeat protein